MNRRLLQIHGRRERLLLRSTAQRDELAALLAPLQAPLAIADRGVAAAQYLRAHPAIVAVAAAVLMVVSPRRTFRWARRAFAVWRGTRWAVQALKELAP